MHFFRSIMYFFMSLLLSSSISKAQNGEINYGNKGEIGRIITVDQSGHGNFTSLQQAINSVPSNNTIWTLIYVKVGVYNEKILIPRDKPFIVLQGEYQSTTIVQWAESGLVNQSSTVTIFADNFVAKKITFKNTYNKVISSTTSGNRILWAPAIFLKGDKNAFYSCSFISLQDTLSDMVGRHYFEQCYITGAVDFIWGYGQSIYQGCVIDVRASELGPEGGIAFITAQGRNNTHDTGGFVFKQCHVTGTGPAYLGRTYGRYSRVILYMSEMDNIIVPQGWSLWDNKTSVNLITYSEVNCTGRGSDKSKRVKWIKDLPMGYFNWITNTKTFINEDGWMDKIPLAFLKF